MTRSDKTVRSDAGGASPPVSARMRPGDVLSDRYEIRGLLGRGGMGAVYEVRDRDLGVDLALKTLAPELLADESAERA